MRSYTQFPLPLTDRTSPRQTRGQALSMLRTSAMTAARSLLSSDRSRAPSPDEPACAAACHRAMAAWADPPADGAFDMPPPRRAQSTAAAGLAPRSTRRAAAHPARPAAVTADGRPMTEVAGVDYRWWLSRGRRRWASASARWATCSRTRRAHRRPGALAGTAPTVTVGVRYRVSTHSAVYADALGARGLPPEHEGYYVNTKVGMEWTPAKSTLGFDKGTLGVHFDSGYRLSFRPRKGGLGVYLRGSSERQRDAVAARKPAPIGVAAPSRRPSCRTSATSRPKTDRRAQGTDSAAAEQSRERMRQAHDDVASGKQDTDRGPVTDDTYRKVRKLPRSSADALLERHLGEAAQLAAVQLVDAAAWRSSSIARMPMRRCWSTRSR